MSVLLQYLIPYLGVLLPFRFLAGCRDVVQLKVYFSKIRSFPVVELVLYQLNRPLQFYMSRVNFM